MLSFPLLVLLGLGKQKQDKRARLIPNKKCTKTPFVPCCSPCVRLGVPFYGSRWKRDLVKTSLYTIRPLTSAYEKAHAKTKQSHRNDWVCSWKYRFSKGYPPSSCLLTPYVVFSFLCWASESWGGWLSLKLNIAEAESPGGYFTLGHLNQQNKGNFNWVKVGKTCISELREHILRRFTHTHTDTHIKRSELQAVNHQALLGNIFSSLKFCIQNRIELKNAKDCLGIIFKPYCTWRSGFNFHL